MGFHSLEIVRLRAVFPDQLYNLLFFVIGQPREAQRRPENVKKIATTKPGRSENNQNRRKTTKSNDESRGQAFKRTCAENGVGPLEIFRLGPFLTDQLYNFFCVFWPARRDPEKHKRRPENSDGEARTLRKCLEPLKNDKKNQRRSARTSLKRVCADNVV